MIELKLSLQVGTLYTVDFEEVDDLALLNDPERMVARMTTIIEEAGLEQIGEPMVHQFSPQGLTYLVLLAQSHLSVHTWPEHRFMAVDFFTCGDQALGWRATETLKRSIPCGRLTVHVVERGIEQPPTR